MSAAKRLRSSKSPIDAVQVAQRPAPGMAVASNFLFAPGDTALAYLDVDARSGGESRQLYITDLSTMTSRPVLGSTIKGDSEDSFTLEEKIRRERQRQQFTGVTQFAWARDAHEGAKIVLPLQGQWLSVHPATSAVKVIVDKDPTGPALDGHVSPNGELLGFVRHGDLHVASMKQPGTPPVRLTYTAAPGITNGLASYLAQEEMDRSQGFWWSPTSQLMAYEHVNELAIPTYRIVHQGSERPGEEEDYRYPFAGKTNPLVKLFVVDVEAACKAQHPTAEPMALDINVFGDEEVYLARVEWFPDGTLAAQVQNRAQSRLRLLRFDARTGRCLTLLEETSAVWINLHDLFCPLRLDKQDYFLWGSERDGFMHLYLYKTLADGTCEYVKQVTAGEWVVEHVAGVDEDAGLVYFHANCHGAMERHLYVVDLAGKPRCMVPPRLTPKGGSHHCVIDHRFKYVCCVRSSTSQPVSATLRVLPRAQALKEAVASANAQVVDGLTAGFQDARPLMIWGQSMCAGFDGDDGVMSVHHTFDAQLDAVDALKLVLHPPRVLAVPAADEQLLLCHVYAPDAAVYGPGPYPTLVAVYGGPHVQRVRNEWASTADLRVQRFVSTGFLVVKCDNRGSSRRGLKFESAIKNRMGTVEVDDQVAVLHALQREGLSDAARVGIVGWSYGGYLAAMCLARRPDVFHVAVAGAPVTSWDGYDSHYTERYMGKPAENPLGYEEASVMHHVAKLDGHLLLVHGLIDENVHFRHTARLINALIVHRKRYELLLFPEERHGPRSLEDRVYLEDRIAQVFETALLS